MDDTNFQAWGRYPKIPQSVSWLRWRNEELPLQNGAFYLPRGMGRSYADVCLIEDGNLISTESLNKIISFDQEKGILRCEAGLSLGELLEFSVPRGWFIPVTPGTKFVSVGGAIANDVHGKNHHCSGTFGRFVNSFELLRSDGERIVCSPEENTALFNATIAGLGLTGLILWAELKLRPVGGPAIQKYATKFHSFKHFYELSQEISGKYEYVVAWLDCLARKNQFGRGVFFYGVHSDKQIKPKSSSSLLRVPIDAPGFLLNPLSMKAFNTLYYNVQRDHSEAKLIHYDPFFYPLDAVHGWNKIYGKNGFLQFQCVVPDAESATRILEKVVDSRMASFLAVLKEFGDVKSPGMLSFPRPGTTLCLDFPMKGEKTLKLFDEFEAIVRDVGGALYPAKDATMSKEAFAEFYPQLEAFKEHKDPRCNSAFWSRVVGE